MFQFLYSLRFLTFVHKVPNLVPCNSIRPYLPRLIFSVAGLFAYSHMDFDVERNTNDTGDPSLAEMAIKALRILANNPEGYFLFVEGKSEVTTSERKSHL